MDNCLFKQLIRLYGGEACSRTTITNLLDPLCEILGADVEEALSSASALCATSDTWVNDRGDKFGALTWQHVTAQFVLKAVCSDVFHIPGSHTAKVLATALKRRIACRTDDSVLLGGLVTDNGANMVAAAAAAAEIVGKANHIRCFAHTLQLAVYDDVIKADVSLQCGSVLRKVRAYVVAITSHSGTRKAFLEAQVVPFDTAPLELVRDVVTRWNSTLYMAQRFLTCKDAIIKTVNSSVLDDFLGSEMVLTAMDWVLLERICTVLVPFEKATRVMSSEAYPTLAMVPQMVRELMLACSPSSVDTDELVKELKRQLLAALHARFGDVFTSVCPALKAAALHPLFGHLPHVGPSMRDKVWDGLVAEAMEFAKSPALSPGHSIPPPMMSAELVRVMLGNLRGYFEANHGKLAEAAGNAPLKAGSFALLWWKEHGAQWSLLHPLVREYLAMPATSVCTF